MEHYYQNIGENWFTFQNIYRTAVENFDNAKFIEIGSWKGRSACFMGVEILNSKKNIDFYCVDTWSGSEEHKDMDIIKNDLLYDEFLKNIEPVSSVIKPIRKTSKEASKDFPDNFFDFIFIDAGHDYDSVKEDIDLWFPKLKNRGIFAGHDYDVGWAGVVKAVDEWSLSQNKKIFITGNSWMHFREGN
jgi:hypothetical protein